MQSAKHTSHQKTAGEHFATVVTGRRGCYCGLSPVRLRSRPRSNVGGNLVGDLGNDATDSLSPAFPAAKRARAHAKPGTEEAIFIWQSTVEFNDSNNP